MPNPHQTLPKLRHHKPSGRAVVRLNGHDHYLGAWGDPGSRERYDRMIADWLARGRQQLDGRADSITVGEVMLAYLRYAKNRYRDEHGNLKQEVNGIRNALRPVRKLFETLPVEQFGSRCLMILQQEFVSSGLSRKFTNQQIGRVRRMFKWATANEQIPPSIFHGLGAVDGLRAGELGARENDLVTAIPEEFVTAVYPHVSRQIQAMIRLQLLSGARPGEICGMRAIDIDMRGQLWVYAPARHKTRRYGKQRHVYLGPQAQTVIKLFLNHALDEYLFSPAAVDVERRAALHQNRKIPMSCGNRPGTKRKDKPKRKPGKCYTTGSYRRAIWRGIEAANEAAERTAMASGVQPKVIPRWSPNQLRHTFATKIRREFGVQVAQVLLGHSNLRTTEVYAEVNSKVAEEVLANVG